MNIFISADIEGVAGIANWDEARKTSPDYSYFAGQMTEEVAAACSGANLAGAQTIVVKDAHASARNINPARLPENAKLIRGWSGHPHKMLDGISADYTAVAFIGYHSQGGTAANPLAHTISSGKIDCIRLNGDLASEFLLHAYLASSLGVPVALLSGDKSLCEQATGLNDNIVTVPVLEGRGGATISIHPKRAVRLIEEGMHRALQGDLSRNIIELPERFSLEIAYHFHGDAYRSSFYPGVKQISAKSILFETDDYFEIMRATSFLI